MLPFTAKITAATIAIGYIVNIAIVRIPMYLNMDLRFLNPISACEELLLSMAILVFTENLYRNSTGKK